MARVRSTDRATSLTHSLPLSSISLSRVPELSGEENRLHLRRHAPANSGHLRRRAVGQNAPLGLLYLSTEGISTSSSLVAMPCPRPSRVRVRVPASSYSLRRSSWLGAEQGLCAVTSWCGAVRLPRLRCAPSMCNASTASPPWSYGHRRQVLTSSPLS